MSMADGLVSKQKFHSGTDYRIFKINHCTCQMIKSTQHLASHLVIPIYIKIIRACPAHSSGSFSRAWAQVDKVLLYISGLKITFQLASTVKPAFLWLQSGQRALQDVCLTAQNSEPGNRASNTKPHFSYWFSSRVKQVKGNGLRGKREENI